MKKQAPTSPLLTVDEAATYLNVTPATVRRFRRDGVLPVIKLGGQSKSRIRFRRADVDALIESGYTAATAGPLAR
jgi:excisionase family DNA binding protein